MHLDEVGLMGATKNVEADAQTIEGPLLGGVVFCGQLFNADAFLPGADPIPVDWVNPDEEPVDDDYALWRKAVEQAAGSQGAETVPQAYKRLLSVPEILGVEDQPQVAAVRE